MSHQLPKKLSQIVELEDVSPSALRNAYWEVYDTIVDDERQKFRLEGEADPSEEVYGTYPNITEKNVFAQMQRILEDEENVQDALVELYTFAEHVEQTQQEQDQILGVSPKSPYDSESEMYFALIDKAVDKVYENTTLP